MAAAYAKGLNDTEGSNVFRFTGERGRAAAADTQVARRARAQHEEDVAPRAGEHSCFFAQELARLRELDVTTAFSSLARRLAPLVLSLPLLLLNKAAVLSALLQALADDAIGVSVTSVLALVAVLARDLRRELLPDIAALDAALRARVTPEAPELTAEVFRTLAFLFKYLGKDLAASADAVESLLEAWASLLAHKRLFVRDMACATLALLIRRMVGGDLHRIMTAIVAADPALVGSANVAYMDGRARLLFELCKSSGGALHSRAADMLHVMLTALQPSGAVTLPAPAAALMGSGKKRARAVASEARTTKAYTLADVAVLEMVAQCVRYICEYTTNPCAAATWDVMRRTIDDTATTLMDEHDTATDATLPLVTVLHLAAIAHVLTAGMSRFAALSTRAYAAQWVATLCRRDGLASVACPRSAHSLVLDMLLQAQGGDLTAAGSLLRTVAAQIGAHPAGDAVSELDLRFTLACGVSTGLVHRVRATLASVTGSPAQSHLQLHRWLSLPAPAQVAIFTLHVLQSDAADDDSVEAYRAVVLQVLHAALAGMAKHAADADTIWPLILATFDATRTPLASRDVGMEAATSQLAVQLQDALQQLPSIMAPSVSPDDATFARAHALISCVPALQVDDVLIAAALAQVYDAVVAPAAMSDTIESWQLLLSSLHVRAAALTQLCAALQRTPAISVTGALTARRLHSAFADVALLARSSPSCLQQHACQQQLTACLLSCLHAAATACELLRAHAASQLLTADWCTVLIATLLPAAAHADTAVRVCTLRLLASMDAPEVGDSAVNVAAKPKLQAWCDRVRELCGFDAAHAVLLADVMAAPDAAARSSEQAHGADAIRLCMQLEALPNTIDCDRIKRNALARVQTALCARMLAPAVAALVLHVAAAQYHVKYATLWPVATALLSAAATVLPRSVWLVLSQHVLDASIPAHALRDSSSQQDSNPMDVDEPADALGPRVTAQSRSQTRAQAAAARYSLLTAAATAWHDCTTAAHTQPVSHVHARWLRVGIQGLVGADAHLPEAVVAARAAARAAHSSTASWTSADVSVSFHHRNEHTLMHVGAFGVTDDVTYHRIVLQCLTAASAVAEQHSRALVAIFVTFLHLRVFPPVSPTATAGADLDSLELALGTRVPALLSSMAHAAQAARVQHVCYGIDDARIIERNLSWMQGGTTGQVVAPVPLAPAEQLVSFLNLFAQFRNWKGIVGADLLHRVCARVLLRPEGGVAAAALQTLASMRFSFMTPYVEPMTRLLQDGALRDAMVALPLAARSAVIREDHRHLFLPYVLRVLVGRMSQRKGRNARDTLASRRTAVLSYCASLDTAEVPLLLAVCLRYFVYAYAPVVHVAGAAQQKFHDTTLASELSDTARAMCAVAAPSSLEEARDVVSAVQTAFAPTASHPALVTPARAIGFLHMCHDLIQQLGSKLQPHLHHILAPLAALTLTSHGANTAAGAENAFGAQVKEIRSLTLLRWVDVVRAYAEEPMLALWIQLLRKPLHSACIALPGAVVNTPSPPALLRLLHELCIHASTLPCVLDIPAALPALFACTSAGLDGSGAALSAHLTASACTDAAPSLGRSDAGPRSGVLMLAFAAIERIFRVPDAHAPPAPAPQLDAALIRHVPYLMRHMQVRMAALTIAPASASATAPVASATGMGMYAAPDVGAAALLRGRKAFGVRQLLLLLHIGAAYDAASTAWPEIDVDQLLPLLLPYARMRPRATAAARGAVEVDLGARVLVLVTALLKRTRSAATYLPFFVALLAPGARALPLAQRGRVIQSVGALCHSAGMGPQSAVVVGILLRLNARAARVDTGMDYDTVVAALHEMDRAWFQSCFLAASPAAPLLPAVLHQCIFLMHESDMAARQAALASVTGCIQACIDTIAAPHSMAHILSVCTSPAAAVLPSWLRADAPAHVVALHALVAVLVPDIRSSFSAVSMLIRRNFIILLSDIVRAARGTPLATHLPALYPQLHMDLAVMFNDTDTEQDVFLNVTHLQVHRRARALLRLAQLVDSGALTLESIQHFIFPLTLHSLYDEVRGVSADGSSLEHRGVAVAPGGKRAAYTGGLHSEAVNLIAVLARHINWRMYMSTFRSLVRQLKRTPALEKVLLRAIAAMAENIPVPDATTLEATHAALQADAQALGRLEFMLQTGLAPRGSAPIVADANEDQPQHEHDDAPDAMDLQAEPDEEGDAYGAARHGTDDDDEDMADEPVADEDDVASVHSDAAPEGKAALELVMEDLARIVIPTLFQLIQERTVNEAGDLDAAPKHAAASFGMLRPGIAAALARVLFVLPPQLRRDQHVKILTKLVNALRARSQEQRDMARETLAKVVCVLGHDMLFPVLQQLRGSLVEGYQTHVIGHAVHDMIASLAPTLSADATSHALSGKTLDILLDIILDDVLGFTAEARADESGYRPSLVLREAKVCKSFATLELVAKHIPFLPSPEIHQITAPLLSAFDDFARAARSAEPLRRLLKHVQTGLRSNASVTADTLLQYVHGVIAEYLPVTPIVVPAPATATASTSAAATVAVKRKGSKKGKLKPVKTWLVRSQPSVSTSTASVADTDIPLSAAMRMRGVDVTSRPADTHRILPEPVHASQRVVSAVVGRAGASGRVVTAGDTPLGVFALGLMLTSLQRGLLASARTTHASMLDPLVGPLAGLARVGPTEEVRTLSMKLLTILMPLPLPAARKNGNAVTRAALQAVEATAGSSAAVSDASSAAAQLGQAALRLLTTLVRSCDDVKLGEEELRGLITLVQADVHSSTRQNAGFGMLKALIARRVMLAEMYETMDDVRVLLVTALRPSSRTLCARVLLEFLLRYPMTDTRLKGHFDFFVSNLEYEREDGRLAVMDMLCAIIAKFPAPVLETHARSIFVPLVARVAADVSPTCRASAAALITQLLQRVEQSMAVQLLGMCLQWMRPTQSPSLRRAGLSVCGLAADAAPALMSTVADASSGATTFMEHILTSVCGSARAAVMELDAHERKLTAAAAAVPSAGDEGGDALIVSPGDANAVQSRFRAIAEGRVGDVYADTDAGDDGDADDAAGAAGVAGTLTLAATRDAGASGTPGVASSMLVTAPLSWQALYAALVTAEKLLRAQPEAADVLVRVRGDDAPQALRAPTPSWATFLERARKQSTLAFWCMRLMLYPQTLVRSAVTRLLAAFLARAISLAPLSVAPNTALTMHTDALHAMAMFACDQLRSELVTAEAADATGRVLLHATVALHVHAQRTTDATTADAVLADAHEEMEEEDMDDDGSEDEAEEDAITATQPRSMRSIFSRLTSVALRHGPVAKETAVKFLAAMCTVLPSEQMTAYLRFAVRVLSHIISSRDSDAVMPPALRAQAQEACDLFTARIGSHTFVSAMNEDRKRADARRVARTQQLALEKVVDPHAAARRAHAKNAGKLRAKRARADEHRSRKGKARKMPHMASN